MKNKKKYQILSKAPIIEAIIDFQFEPDNNISVDDLEKFYDKVKNNYSIKKRKMASESGFNIDKDGNVNITAVETKPIGFRFENVNEKKIIQLQLNRLIFNKLKPYENWNTFLEEYKIFYDQYYQMFKPNRLVKIVVRYINEIQLPLPFVDFDEYFNTFPKIDDNLPQDISNLFMNLELIEDKIGAMGVIIIGIKGIVNDSLNILFDISVNKNVNLNIASPEIWDNLEKLRNFKNKIFFKSLTERTLEFYK